MVQQALKIKTTTKEGKNQQDATSPLLGNSKPINHLREQIKKVARTQAPVLISGESGTGKELAACLIHNLSPRASQPFVPVNCGAIPSELMESEFFGHQKGSFTGAIKDKQGLFQSASGGTLFLDEVADLPLHMQVKMLRAIQEKAVRPVGSEQESAIDVRILSATHKDLSKELSTGNFRQDLYYRINVIEITLPSLRERKSDIPLLAHHFLEKISENNDMGLCEISQDALDALNNYLFPGNVRELENILERASTLCENNLIDVDDLNLTTTITVNSPAHAEEVKAETTTKSATEINQSTDSLDDYLENIEKKVILEALEKTRWNRTAAAEMLGISFRQMRHRLKKFGIE
jgi:two-component system response regulator PilR (NtrC family)